MEPGIGAPSVRKALFKLQLLPRWLMSADFRLAFTSGVSANQVCFERELLTTGSYSRSPTTRRVDLGGAAGEVHS